MAAAFLELASKVPADRPWSGGMDLSQALEQARELGRFLRPGLDDRPGPAAQADTAGRHD